jgi:hypothetical protein
MTRNALLNLSLKSRGPRPPAVWRMTRDLIGLAFGTRPVSDRERDR